MTDDIQTLPFYINQAPYTDTICLPSLWNNSETMILQCIIVLGKPWTLKFNHTITSTDIGNQWLVGVTHWSGIQFLK